MKIQEVSFI